jgi:sialic acid synthase SpsE
MQKKIILIAEIGENHLGKINYAKKMIRYAKYSRADYVKFQSYNEKCLTKNDPEYEWFKRVSLSNKDHYELQNYSRKQKIKFMSSPFSLERAEFLCERLKMKEIKVASAKITDLRLLRYLNKKCNKVYLSTGLSNINEIKKSLKVLSNVGVNILHCVSEYPLKYQNANLLAIKHLKEKFPNYTIGYSDHTIGNIAVLTAVALGATVIEKHFTLNKKFEGTDHILSASRKDLLEIRNSIDNIAKLLGNEKKTLTKKEKKILKFVRNRFKN